MKRILIILTLTIVVLFTVSATAADKVVVIPLGGCSNQNQSVPTVTSANDRIWMDRNLGASRVATSSTDTAAYGDLYQWGRLSDGHERLASGINATLSTTDDPGHGDFIRITSSPTDWRKPQNDNLWQGVSGTNNPCPSDFRIPTQTEWDTERLSWSDKNATGAFASPLKLTQAGFRGGGTGGLITAGTQGYYWSSTVGGTYSGALRYTSSSAIMSIYPRGTGYSVRCIKN